MGMAATSDQKTLSAILSRSSRFHVYNLGVRAYNGFQELILTQSLINKFNKLKKIFIMSGINDLYFFLDPNFTKRFPGPQAYGYELYSVKKEHLTFYQRLKFNFKDNKKLEINEKIDLASIIKRNLKLWSIFSKSENIEVVYFLQPFLTWGLSKKANHNKNKMDYGKTSIMNKMDGNYKFLKELLEEACLQNNIGFVDLNNLELNKEDMFEDRVHLNDKGFEELAKTFKKYL
jgi:lysophospholipase L1-like esterase